MSDIYTRNIGNVVYGRPKQFTCRHCKREEATYTRGKLCCDRRECKEADRLRKNRRGLDTQRIRRERGK